MLEPLTKATIIGLIFGTGAFIAFFLFPVFAYNFIFGVLRDISIIYSFMSLFGPPEFASFQSLLLSQIPGYPIANVNFSPTLLLLGLPVSVAAFFVGFFKGRTVGHGLGSLAFTLLLGAWFLLGLGNLGIIVFLQNASVPLRYILTTSFPYIEPVYLNYTAPWIFNIQGIINLITLTILLTSIVWLVEIGIGISNNDYWRYWSST